MTASKDQQSAEKNMTVKLKLVALIVNNIKKSATTKPITNKEKT